MPGEFTERDIAFLLEVADRRLLTSLDIIKDDRTFVDSLLETQATEIVRRLMLMSQDAIVSSITPRFLFEALLRAARKELSARAYTTERDALQRIPVFDTRDVLRFLRDDAIIKYLAQMLTSFTRIRSFTWPVRIRKGVWRRVRFNDMDIDSLMRYSETVDKAQRFPYYQRIGDLCLFILGIFPEYAGGRAYPGHGIPAIPVFGRHRRSAEDYEREGRHFYRIASEHEEALTQGIGGILRKLDDNFHLAEKPLNLISERYLDFNKGRLFPAIPGE